MTVLHEYLELNLGNTIGTTLARHVNTKRDEGMTWQQVADDLHRITGRPVSRETLRQWFNEQKVPAQ